MTYVYVSRAKCGCLKGVVNATDIPVEDIQKHLDTMIAQGFDVKLVPKDVMIAAPFYCPTHAAEIFEEAA